MPEASSTQEGTAAPTSGDERRGRARPLAEGRRASLERLWGIAFLCATWLVSCGLSKHQEGMRLATAAQLPMREMTVDEAAYLLGLAARGEAEARVEGVSADFAEIRTNRFVTRQGTVLVDHLASYSNYCSRYRLPRAPLEATLGRRLRPEPLGSLASCRVTFVGSYVPFYCLIELGFLTAWLFLLGWGATRVRQITALLPALYLWLFVLDEFLAVYSPALFDADLFHQRVVVEELALLVVVSRLFLEGPALYSACLWVAVQIFQTTYAAFHERSRPAPLGPAAGKFPARVR